jgi:hypothetical protein
VRFRSLKFRSLKSDAARIAKSRLSLRCAPGYALIDGYLRDGVLFTRRAIF